MRSTTSPTSRRTGLLPRPRHGGGARPSRRLPGRALLGDAVDRNARQRRCRPLPAARPDRPLRAARRCPRSRAIDLAPAPAGARPLPLAAAGRGDRARRSRPAAGAALPQPPRLCAADALPHLRPPLASARTARPGWSSIASAACSSATIAATPSGGRTPARTAARRDSLTPVGPGVERLAEEVAARFPEARTHRPVERHAGGIERLRHRARGDRQGRGRHRHRHAARRQGPQFPAA